MATAPVIERGALLVAGVEAVGATRMERASGGKWMSEGGDPSIGQAVERVIDEWDRLQEPPVTGEWLRETSSREPSSIGGRVHDHRLLSDVRDDPPVGGDQHDRAVELLFFVPGARGSEPGRSRPRRGGSCRSKGRGSGTGPSRSWPAGACLRRTRRVMTGLSSANACDLLEDIDGLRERLALRDVSWVRMDSTIWLPTCHGEARSSGPEHHPDVVAADFADLVLGRLRGLAPGDDLR